MSDFNLVVVMGRLTRDIELRYTPKGVAIANMSVAVNRRWTSEAGEKKEEVTFVECTLFGRTAENCAQYLKKGSSAHVSGRLKGESWDDKQTGQKRSKMVVVAESVQFIGSKSDSAQPSAPAAPRSARQAATPAPAGEPLEGDGPPESDDVPF